MNKQLNIITALCFLFFFTLNTYAQEGSPESCDCNTIIVSEEEASSGCPASVKEETCPVYRDAMMKKEQLQREEELRKMRKNMEPRYTLPK